MVKILVIEDETFLREEMIEWLTLEGYEAIGASEGLEGIKLAIQEAPALIVSDVTMPRMDGYALLVEVRAHPLTAEVPFIFVTARAAHEDIRKGMVLGADDYITKPFTRLEFLGAVQARLEKQSAFEQKLQSEVSLLQDALAQEHERRMLKARLIAMFSHDFRNPLTSIISSNSILRDYDDRLDTNQRLTHLNRVEASSRQLLQMLDDMLVIAQLETNSINFQPEPLQIQNFLQAIIEEFQFIHRETHSLVFEGHLPDTMMADPRLMRQIAANLISNAIKYSPLGSKIDIRLERSDNQLLFTVRDHGIGIPEADQERLFNAFQRASNVGKVRGTGLGLAIVKQAVDLHGGSIHLESRYGEGTTIRVAIPI